MASISILGLACCQCPIRRGWYAFDNIVECRYNAVQFMTILFMALWWQQRNLNQTLYSQQTPQTSPSRASFGLSTVRIWEKIDRLITAPRCASLFFLIGIIFYSYALTLTMHHWIHVAQRELKKSKHDVIQSALVRATMWVDLQNLNSIRSAICPANIRKPQKWDERKK